MVKKNEEKGTEDEIKEKDGEDKTEIEVIEEKDKTEEIPKEEAIKKEIGVSTVETKTINEVKLKNDPWSAESWKESFPELFETEVLEKAEGLTQEDVIRICREQIKEWLKGVDKGDYPLPKSLMQPSIQIPKKSDIEGLDEEFEKSIAIHKSYDEKFQDIAKTFEEIKKEVQIIKDTPVDFIEKSIKNDNDKVYKSEFKTLKDGTITVKSK